MATEWSERRYGRNDGRFELKTKVSLAEPPLRGAHRSCPTN